MQREVRIVKMRKDIESFNVLTTVFIESTTGSLDSKRSRYATEAFAASAAAKKGILAG